MSRIEFLADDIWERISHIARRSRRRHVAVAYIPSAGFEMLPLSKDDVLVVDVSKPRVKAGGTDPAVIARYLKRGVNVTNLPSLHAKVFVFDDTAIVGSTNVSKYSRDTLTEAAILTTDPETVDSARTFINQLAEDSYPVDEAYIREVQKLFQKHPWEPGATLPSRKSLRDWSYKVMEKVAGRRPAYREEHGYFISLSNTSRSGAIGSAFVRLDSGIACLRLYPGDDIEQARPFYRNVEPAKLNALRRIGWSVQGNLHFGGSFGRGWPPYVTRPPMGFSSYVEYWRQHLEEIGTYERAQLTSKIREFRQRRLMPNDASAEAEDVRRLKRFKSFGVRPGVKLEFKWPPFRAGLPAPSTFAPNVRNKINEAVRTWGDSFP